MRAPAAFAHISPGPSGRWFACLAWKRSIFYAVEHLASHSTCLIKHHHGLFHYSQGSSTSSAPFPPGLSNCCPTTLSLQSIPTRLPSTSLLPYYYARPRCLLGFFSPPRCALAPPTEPLVRLLLCRERVACLQTDLPPPSRLLFQLPNMAATQQLPMQSRTGRVNQRKYAHETPE